LRGATIVKRRLLVYNCAKWLELRRIALKPSGEEIIVNAKEKYQKLLLSPIGRFDQMNDTFRRARYDPEWIERARAFYGPAHQTSPTGRAAGEVAERRPIKPPFVLVSGAVLHDGIARKLLHGV
jgi:hypothetical protein